MVLAPCINNINKENINSLSSTTLINKPEIIYFLYCNPISFHFASINVYDFLKNSTIRNYYFFTCCILTITSDKKFFYSH